MNGATPAQVPRLLTASSGERDVRPPRVTAESRPLGLAVPDEPQLGSRVVVGVQEVHGALEAVAPVLGTLPAMLLLVVPVDLVMLALDLERLDHALGHERHDALVLATVEDEERRLDALRAVDR